MFFDELKQFDSEVFAACQQELQRQQHVGRTGAHKGVGLVTVDDEEVAGFHYAATVGGSDHYAAFQRREDFDIAMEMGLAIENGDDKHAYVHTAHMFNELKFHGLPSSHRKQNYLYKYHNIKHM